MISPGFRWDRSSRAVLGDALVRLGPERCGAEVRPDEIVLHETDPDGRDLILSCGADLTGQSAAPDHHPR
jgi:hypothetical protein